MIIPVQFGAESTGKTDQFERARTAAKGWLTRAASKLEAMLAREDRVSEEWRLEALVAEAEFMKRLEAFDEAQLAVEAVISEERMMEDIDKSAAFRDSFSGLRARFTKSVQAVTADVAADASSSAQASSSAHSQRLKLPKLSLPKFSGDVELWQVFWESFTECVDSADLSEVSKFSYLRSLLKGEALTAISGLSLTGASYKTACDLLKGRYGRPEKLIFIHIEALLRVEHCSLQDLQDKLLSHIRSLKGLGIKSDNYGVFLTPLVLSKLPEDVRMEWARAAEGKESDLDFLLKFLASEISRRERSGSLVCWTDRNRGAAAPADTKRMGPSVGGRGPRAQDRPATTAGGGMRPDRPEAGGTSWSK